MTRKEILSRLEKGEFITKSTYMVFKRGKLKRGNTYAYQIGEDSIKANQFDSVFDLLEKVGDQSTLSFVVYRLRGQLNKQ